LTDFIQILQMFIIWDKDNLSKISGKLERVPWPLPENWHGMAPRAFHRQCHNCNLEKNATKLTLLLRSRKATEKLKAGTLCRVAP